MSNAFNYNLCQMGNYGVLPTLGCNPPINFGGYANFMTPQFSKMQPPASFNLSSALSSVPNGTMQNFMPAVGAFAGATAGAEGLKKLLQDGIITKEEYKSQLRKMNGFSSTTQGIEENNSPINPFETLSNEDVTKARKSNNGAYSIKKEHSQVASEYIEAAKEILKKEPIAISEGELSTVEKIFNELNKNPMIAESFVKQANETTFAGKTTTLLGAYEQALTKRYGRKEAKNIISETKENLEKNVNGRNADAWKTFDQKSKEDSSNVDYTFGDRVSKNPIKYGVPAVVGGALLAKPAFKGARAITKVLPGGWKTIGWAALADATALAYFGSEEK